MPEELSSTPSYIEGLRVFFQQTLQAYNKENRAAYEFDVAALGAVLVSALARCDMFEEADQIYRELGRFRKTNRLDVKVKIAEAAGELSYCYYALSTLKKEGRFRQRAFELLDEMKLPYTDSRVPAIRIETASKIIGWASDTVVCDPEGAERAINSVQDIIEAGECIKPYLEAAYWAYFLALGLSGCEEMEHRILQNIIRYATKYRMPEFIAKTYGSAISCFHEESAINPADVSRLDSFIKAIDDLEHTDEVIYEIFDSADSVIHIFVVTERMREAEQYFYKLENLGESRRPDDIVLAWAAHQILFGYLEQRKPENAEKWLFRMLAAVSASTIYYQGVRGIVAIFTLYIDSGKPDKARHLADWYMQTIHEHYAGTLQEYAAQTLCACLSAGLWDEAEQISQTIGEDQESTLRAVCNEATNRLGTATALIKT